MSFKILNENNSSKQIKIGAIISYLAIFLNVVAGLIYTPWMISVIGQSDYGIYTLGMSLIGFFVMDFGLGAAISKFISNYLANNKREEIERLLGIIFKLYLILDSILFIILLVVYFLLDILYSNFTSDQLEKIKLVYIMVGLFSIVSFPFTAFNGILISYERFVFIKLCDITLKLLTIFMMVIVLLLGYKLYALVAVNALVGIFVIIIKYFYLKKHRMLKTDFNYKNKALLKEIFNFAMWDSIILIASRFIINITSPVLGAFSGTIQISIFAIGSLIEGYTYTVANALNGLFLPKISRILVSDNQKEELEKLMIKIGRIQFFIVGLLVVGYIVLGKEFIELWLGDNFKSSYYVALLMLIPSLVTLTQEIARTTLIATNNIKYRAIVTIGTGIVSLIMLLIFAERWGAIGAAFSISVASILGYVIAMNIVYYKVLKINIIKFFIECHFKMSMPFILTLILGFIGNSFITISNVSIFSLKVFIIVAIYFILMWIISLNYFEKKLFKDTMKKIIQKTRR
ncbi:oligosaccharide flippase family protein [Planococcus liqunii]|uniref:oligosaccharide flippase family protein n=1 Tax=Planococcus liqunii TaxID=3058394 RepID=UPI002603B3AC|nr:oligosaccharide flippase family protein [Planococcus sp. N056]WKA50210.1 oligosaccharide flippase family protein [Planococcus sp. N056]